MDTEQEALEIQVYLKAEQAGIPCGPKTLPGLMELARKVGAPYSRWYFKKEGSTIRAIEEG